MLCLWSKPPAWFVCPHLWLLVVRKYTSGMPFRVLRALHAVEEHLQTPSLTCTELIVSQENLPALARESSHLMSKHTIQLPLFKRSIGIDRHTDFAFLSLSCRCLFLSRSSCSPLTASCQVHPEGLVTTVRSTCAVTEGVQCPQAINNILGPRVLGMRRRRLEVRVRDPG